MKYYYTAVLTPQKDGSVYACVPDLDGCVTSGKDLNDALDMITDAASVWLVSNEDHEVILPGIVHSLTDPRGDRCRLRRPGEAGILYQLFVAERDARDQPKVAPYV